MKSLESLCEELYTLHFSNYFLRLVAMHPLRAITLALPFIPAVAEAHALASAAMELAYPSRCFGTTPAGKLLLAK